MRSADGPIAVALIAFICLFGGSLLGMVFRNRLPEHHLNDESRHLLGMGLGVIGTMAGLVLGLLVASATGAYNAQRGELLDGASKIVMLDRLLAHYGPQADRPRGTLRVAVQRTLLRIWPREPGNTFAPPSSATGAEGLLDQIEDLSPRNDAQRSLKSEAIGMAIDLGQINWLMYEQSESSFSMALLVVLIFWFTITFVGFGLFAPANATVVIALGLCSLAVSGAILVLLEMYMPFAGLVQISSTPLREALRHLTR
jgi:hypothetical protein